MPICYSIMDKRAIFFLSLNFMRGLCSILHQRLYSQVSTYIGGHLGRPPDLINQLLPLLFKIFNFDLILSLCILKRVHIVCVHNYNLFSTHRSHFASMYYQLKCYCACFKLIRSRTVITNNAFAP